MGQVRLFIVGAVETRAGAENRDGRIAEAHAPAREKSHMLTINKAREDTVHLHLSGKWTVHGDLPTAAEVRQAITGAGSVQRVSFETSHLSEWDSSLITFLLKVRALCLRRRVHMDESGLPQGVRRLMALATAVPERKGARRSADTLSLLSRIGRGSLSVHSGAKDMVAFVGDTFLTFLRFLRGKAHYRRSDLFLTIQECGSQALPIVTLISFLVGLTLAFVGSVQLQQFGAQIYVANLVGLGMAREMGAMMTAVIMAGRTGAAFAAQLGTMRVNQEIDSFITMGISPMEFLVLPRMLALMLMMPLLCIYSDLLGMLGGWFVGITMLDLGTLQYLQQTQGALRVTDFGVGLIKSVVFGVLVALAGCFRGMQSGSSASAVGIATTSAVVTGIVFIVVADAILTVILDDVLDL